MTLMEKVSFLLVSLIPVVACTATAISATEKMDQVRIVIENDADEPMRCIAVIAHFLTKQIGTIEKGQKVAVGYTLHEDGSLSQGEYKGKAVYVENLRCGADSDWSRTSADIPLDLLRGRKVRNLKAVCGIDGRLSCKLEEAPR